MEDNACPDCPTSPPIQAWLFFFEPEIETYCNTCGRTHDWCADLNHTDAFDSLMELGH